MLIGESPLAFALTTDQLETFDRAQLLTLRSNARRLQADAGPRAAAAEALLPLIEAELIRRAPAASPAKKRVKKVVAAPAAEAEPSDPAPAAVKAPKARAKKTA